MPSSWDGLEKERLKKERERKEITEILFHAQAVNYQPCLLLPNMLNCLHIYGSGAHQKFRLCNFIYQARKMSQ